MELYDKANELAKAIQNCKEYVELVEAGKVVGEEEKKAPFGCGFLNIAAHPAFADSNGNKPVPTKIETPYPLAGKT